MDRKKTKKKKPSRKTLIRKLDDILSKYVRLKEKGICYTCGFKNDWKLMDAGHYIKRQHQATRFIETNIHCQCRACNRFKGGNMNKYAVHLEEDYGYGILQKFERLKNKGKDLTIIEFQEKIIYYQNQVEILEKEL